MRLTAVLTRISFSATSDVTRWTASALIALESSKSCLPSKLRDRVPPMSNGCEGGMATATSSALRQLGLSSPRKSDRTLERRLRVSTDRLVHEWSCLLCRRESMLGPPRIKIWSKLRHSVASGHANVVLPHASTGVRGVHSRVTKTDTNFGVFPRVR